MENDLLESSAITIIMGVRDGEPIAELLVDDEQMQNTQKIAADFLKLYSYLAGGAVAAHAKMQFKHVSENLGLDCYSIFQKKIEDQINKNIVKATKPFINPLDVFRRGK